MIIWVNTSSSWYFSYLVVVRTWRNVWWILESFMWWAPFLCLWVVKLWILVINSGGVQFELVFISTGARNSSFDCKSSRIMVFKFVFELEAYGLCAERFLFNVGTRSWICLISDRFIAINNSLWKLFSTGSKRVCFVTFAMYWEAWSGVIGDKSSRKRVSVRRGVDI